MRKQSERKKGSSFKLLGVADSGGNSIYGKELRRKASLVPPLSGLSLAKRIYNVP